MSQVTNSNPVVAGNDALAQQYNNLRTDLLQVEANSPPIGSIVMWAGDTGDIPAGWELCDGTELNRTTYATLFARLGTTFGAGDESTTFNIPDLQDKFIVGAGSSYDRADSGGANTVDTSHTHTGPSHTHTGPSHRHTGPSHTHSISSHSHNYNHDHGTSDRYCVCGGACSTHYDIISLLNLAGGGTDTGGWSGSTNSSGTGNTGYSGTDNTGASGTGATSSSGSSSLENRPPYVGLFYIIKVL